MNIFVHVGFVIAERNLYLSVAGYSLLVAKGVCKISRELKGVYKKCLYSFVILMFLSFALRSHARSYQWKKEIDLFSSGLNVCHKNAKVHYNIAKKLVDQKKIEEAVLFYKESVRIEPEYEHALNNLGNLLKTKKKFVESEKLLRKATQINPRFAAAFMNLAIVEQAQGDFDQSERDYLKALDLRAVYPDCQFNLGNLYLKTKQLEKAEFRFVLATKHKHQLAFANLIILLDEQERLEEAHNSILEAHDLFPENPEFMFQLANSFGKQGEFVESEKFYLKAIAREAKALYWSNLGVLYHRWDKLDSAEAAYTMALQLDSNMGSARNNLEKLRNKLRK
jgi:Flp pilus assembly protein TadD